MSNLKSKPTKDSANTVRKKKSQRVRVYLLVLALIAGGFGAAIASLLSSKPFQQQTLTPEQAAAFGNSDIISAPLGLPTLTHPVNVLILGTIVLSDDLPNAPPQPIGKYLAQENSSLNGQSDAMLLVRFDPSTPKVTVLSIPRDSKVEISGYGVQKINAANYIDGAVLSAKVVSKLAGVTIDRYLRVNVQGFEQLIDALGGVDIYVPKKMRYQDDSQHLYINLNRGQQHLDGNRAIQYMRYRHDELGDIGRVQRQQTFFRTLIAQKLKPDLVTKIPDILAVLKQNLDTNLSVMELMATAAFLAKIDRKDTKMLMVPGRFSTPSESTLSYWIVDNHHLSQIMAEHFDIKYTSLAGGNYLTPKDLRVAIQDTTYHPDRIKVATNVLLNAGFRQTYPADERPTVILETTQIIAQQGDLASAEQVRSALGIGEVILESTGVLESDVTVRLGRDYLKAPDKKQTNASF